MKVIVAGSRTITSSRNISDALRLSNFQYTEIVSGGAKGADKLGELVAEALEIPVKRFPANWLKFGKSAGFRRNAQMAEYADALIAVWDGKSKGTAHMIKTMQRLRKPIYVHEVCCEF